MESVMNASQQMAKQSESEHSNDSGAIDPPVEASKREFAWYGGQVDERVLRVIAQLRQAAKQ
jgi:hypothetical protein